MDSTMPTPEEMFKALKDANRTLLRAMAQEKRHRLSYEAAADELTRAGRHVKGLLAAMQPELPDVGLLPTVPAAGHDV
jgi:hypothetical protein